jgi:hypothetical protein
MTKLSQMQPVAMGLCQELVDLECSDLGRVRELVGSIEATISASRRSQYELALQNAQQNGGGDQSFRDGLRNVD